MEAKIARPLSAESGAPYKVEARPSVRDFVAASRKQPEEAPGESGELSAFIQKAATSSVTELETVIAELKEARNLLKSESERLQREVARYGQLSETASASAKAISETLVQWRQANSPVRR